MRKNIPVSEDVHAQLRAVAQEHGLKIGWLADRVLDAWVSGEVFLLADVLRLRKGKVRRKQRCCSTPPAGPASSPPSSAPPGRRDFSRINEGGDG